MVLDFLVQLLQLGHNCFGSCLIACRVLSLKEECTSAFKEEEFKRSQQLLVTNSCFLKTALDKNLTEGKVEGSIKVYLNFRIF